MEMVVLSEGCESVKHCGAAGQVRGCRGVRSHSLRLSVCLLASLWTRSWATKLGSDRSLCSACVEPSALAGSGKEVLPVDGNTR